MTCLDTPTPLSHETNDLLITCTFNLLHVLTIQVHEAVYDDIEKRGLYEMLWSTRYFGCLVWHLLSYGTISGLLKHTIYMKRYILCTIPQSLL